MVKLRAPYLGDVRAECSVRAGAVDTDEDAVCIAVAVTSVGMCALVFGEERRRDGCDADHICVPGGCQRHQEISLASAGNGIQSSTAHEVSRASHSQHRSLPSRWRMAVHRLNWSLLVTTMCRGRERCVGDDREERV